MTGVHGSKEGVGLKPTQFSQNDPIRPHTQRCPEQVFGGHQGLAQRTAGGDQAHGIGVVEVKFGCVLDEDEPLFLGNLPDQSIEEGRFAGGRAA